MKIELSEKDAENFINNAPKFPPLDPSKMVEFLEAFAPIRDAIQKSKAQAKPKLPKKQSEWIASKSFKDMEYLAIVNQINAKINQLIEYLEARDEVYLKGLGS